MKLGACVVYLSGTWSLLDHVVSCMTILILSLQITRADIKPQVKWAVNLVIVDGHFNLPQGFVCICMDSHTHFTTGHGKYADL